MSKNTELVAGWTNPVEKYARQIESSPQVGVKNKKNIWNHHLDNPMISAYFQKQRPLNFKPSFTIVQPQDLQQGLLRGI